MTQIDWKANYERWRKWMLLEHGQSIESNLQSVWDSFFPNHELFSKNKMYWGCGYDFKAAKYETWDCCDIRENGTILWDVLMGFPQADASMDVVKTKLSLGMFTHDQVKFLLHETARVLKVGGRAEVTDRDFDVLLSRRGELDWKLFVRYIYGSGKYHGSRRKSTWTIPAVEEICEAYRLVNGVGRKNGMNFTIEFVRESGNLRKFGPEPEILQYSDGSYRNEGDDFHSAEITK